VKNKNEKIMRILLVEEDGALNDGVQKGLKRYGYTVDRLIDGKVTLSYIKTEKFDVILLDLNLSGPPGLNILHKMRATGITIPILILTARQAIEDRVKGLDSGADDYLTKPFDLDELSARIRALQRRSSNDETRRERSSQSRSPR
jgi:two-component system response regulator QseB